MPWALNPLQHSPRNEGPINAVGPYGPCWAVQILPFMEQEALYEIAVTANSVFAIRDQPVHYYLCPSRCAGIALNQNTGVSGTSTAANALMDYATATPGDSPGSWDQFWYGNTWGLPTSPIYKGIVVRSGNGKHTNTADVLDGTADTLLAGEKFLRPQAYATVDWHDDCGWTDGWDPDVIRYTAYQPLKDQNNPPTALPNAPTQGYQFGGAHPGGMNALMGDGSVLLSIRFTVSIGIFNRIGDRRDGVPVSATDL